MKKRVLIITVVLALVIVLGIGAYVVANNIAKQETSSDQADTTAAETANTPETTSEPETEAPQTELPETAPPETSSTAVQKLDTSILENIDSDYPLLLEKYGEMVGTTIVLGEAVYMFESYPDVKFGFSASEAEVDLTDFGLDENGVYHGYTPREGVLCYSIGSNNVGVLFPGYDSITFDELTETGEIKHIETHEAPENMKNTAFVSALEYEGHKIEVCHKEQDCLHAGYWWRLEKINTTWIPPVDPVITDTSFSGSEILADIDEREKWYEEVNARAKSLSGSTYAVSITETEIDIMERFLRFCLNLEMFEEVTGAEPGSLAVYRIMELGNYVITLVPTDGSDLSYAHEVELDVEIVRSRNDVLTPGWHKITFSRGPSPHMIVDGRTPTSWSAGLEGIEKRALQWSMLLAAERIYSVDDLVSLAYEEDNSRFIELALLNCDPEGQTEFSGPDYKSVGSTWYPTYDYFVEYVEEYYGVSDVKIAQSSKVYTYQDGCIRILGHGVAIPCVVADISTSSEGRMTVTFECWADPAMTVRAKIVEYVYEIKDGRLKPVEFNITEDYGFDPCLFGGL